MSFLFRVNGIEQQKTSKIMMVLNFVQAGCGWFEFIACIMLGNILKQTKDLFGSISETTYKTYNPLLALFSIIGILQTLFGAFVALALMGILPFLQTNRPLWTKVIHYGFLVQFGFISYICLQTSTQATIFAAINDSFLAQFYRMSTGDPKDPNFKYYESFVVYSRYLIAWAILEFFICLPISLANIYALHTRHINYEALAPEKEEKAEESGVRPQMQYSGRNDESDLGVSGMQDSQMQGGNMMQQAGNSLEPSKPLEVQMLPN